MKTKKILFLGCVILACIIASCSAPKKVAYSGKQIAPVETIALYSTMIGKVVQPKLPLIDAAAFNAKTNSVADEIMNLEKKNMENFRTLTANSLMKNFNCKVLCDESLHASETFSQLSKRHNCTSNLQTENDHFPVILISADDINPFPFEKGAVVKFFTEENNYKAIAKDLCSSLNTDMVAFSYTELYVLGVGPLGTFGSLRLDTHVFMFDKEGDLVLKGHNWSKPNPVKGKEIEQYEDQLNNFSIIIDPLMAEMASACKTK